MRVYLDAWEQLTNGRGVGLQSVHGATNGSARYFEDAIGAEKPIHGIDDLFRSRPAQDVLPAGSRTCHKMWEMWNDSVLQQQGQQNVGLFHAAPLHATQPHVDLGLINPHENPYIQWATVTNRTTTQAQHDDGNFLVDLRDLLADAAIEKLAEDGLGWPASSSHSPTTINGNGRNVTIKYDDYEDFDRFYDSLTYPNRSSALELQRINPGLLNISLRDEIPLPNLADSILAVRVDGEYYHLHSAYTKLSGVLSNKFFSRSNGFLSNIVYIESTANHMAFEILLLAMYGVRNPVLTGYDSRDYVSALNLADELGCVPEVYDAVVRLMRGHFSDYRRRAGGGADSFPAETAIQDISDAFCAYRTHRTQLVDGVTVPTRDRPFEEISFAILICEYFHVDDLNRVVGRIDPELLRLVFRVLLRFGPKRGQFPEKYRLLFIHPEW